MAETQKGIDSLNRQLRLIEMVSMSTHVHKIVSSVYSELVVSLSYVLAFVGSLFFLASCRYGYAEST